MMTPFPWDSPNGATDGLTKSRICGVIELGDDELVVLNDEALHHLTIGDIEWLKSILDIDN